MIFIYNLGKTNIYDVQDNIIKKRIIIIGTKN